VISAPSALGHAEELNSWESVRDFVQGRIITLDEVLPHLSIELRSNYNIGGFEGRSLQSESTPDAPRIIHRSRDARLSIAYPMENTIENGNLMEFLFQPADTERLEGKLIEFLPGKPPRIHEFSTRCFACHGDMSKEEFKTFVVNGGKLPNRKPELRHIWDTYPDWPGFFGSAHNGQTWHGAINGTSHTPILEYEKEAFARLLRRADDQPRIRYLVGLKSETIMSMAERNLSFGVRLAELNLLRWRRRLVEAGVYEAGKKQFEVTRQGPAPDNYAKSALASVKERNQRIVKLAKKYGTQADHKYLKRTMDLTAMPNGGTKIALRESFYRAEPVLAAAIESTGLSASDLGLAKELGSYTLDDGKTAPHAQLFPDVGYGLSNIVYENAVAEKNRISIGGVCDPKSVVRNLNRSLSFSSD
jgi:hypothetical protein